MTPEEAAKIPKSGGDPKKVEEFLTTASARDLQRFMHSVGAWRSDNQHWFLMARAALDIWIAEDADKTAKTVVKLTRWLIVLTVVLAVITLPTFIRELAQIFYPRP